MPILVFKQWEKGELDRVDFEICRTTFCFELRDWETRIFVFLSEYCKEGGTVLRAELQKKERYKSYIKKMLEFDFDPNSLEGSPQFLNIYASALSVFNNKSRVELQTKWRENGIEVDVRLVLKERHIHAAMGLSNQYNSLYYSVMEDTDEYKDRLKAVMKDFAGLYALFRDYVKGGETQEKT